jgi:phenylpropionate dioxygenase-like ring-hydroxylating dioxygenase large terminal subunit
VEESHEEDPAASSSSKDLYDFQRQWYPVGVVKDFEKRVERREPIEVWLLGKRYVVWRKPKLGPNETENNWSVSIDVCPHRLAPLTEGRIEDDGDLMCSYHGWEFDCSGKCSSLPQAPQQLESNMQNEKRSCLSLLPVEEKYGLVWIWPDISPQGLEASKSTQSMSIPPCDAVESGEVDTVDIDWYVRDLPYDWDTFVENIVDPTHVPYAHHGIQGNRKKPGEFGMRLVRSKKDEGVRIDLCPKDPDKVNVPEEQAKHEGSFIEFRPPFLIRYNFQSNSAFGGGKKKKKEKKKEEEEGKPLAKRRSANLVVMGVPTRPGHVRCLFKFAILNAEALPKIAKWMISRRPAWMDHMTRNKVFDSDGYLLYLQEKELAYGSKKDWKDKFHMPTSADTLVIAFRKWIDKFTDAGPYGSTVAGAGHPLATLSQKTVYSKREVLDRYEQHTKHCRFCSTALRNFKVLQAVAVAGFLVSCWVRSRPLVGLVCLALAGFAEHWKRKFYYVDHIHAHVD